MCNECQKPEIRAHRATDWSVTQQRWGWLAGGVEPGAQTALEEGCECGFGRTERETGRGRNEDAEDSITEQ